MLAVPFNSKTVQEVFELMEIYEKNGIFPDLGMFDVNNLLKCTLYLGIDILSTKLIEYIAINVSQMEKELLDQIPYHLLEFFINSIPISQLDIDFLVSYFSISSIYPRFCSSNIQVSSYSPFSTLFEKQIDSDENRIANSLIECDLRFMKSSFVRSYCSILTCDKIIDFSKFLTLTKLSISSANIDEPLYGVLPQTLTYLEITHSRLKPTQIDSIMEFLLHSKIKFLSLRDDRLGPKGCDSICTFFNSCPIIELQYLDIALNAIGSEGITKLLLSIPNTNIKSIALDGNFFQPSSDFLNPISSLSLHSISLRALHWDYPSAEIVRKLLQKPEIIWWDLSAQVIHQNSDPDLSSEMATFLFSDSPPHIQSLFFSNHGLTKFSLSFVLNMNLKSLTLSNSNISEQDIDIIVPIISKLEFLDLSYNYLRFKSNLILNACSESNSLRFLNLSANEIGDSNGFLFFQEMERNQSCIKTLKLRMCHLSKRSNIAIISLLSKGVMMFDELDLSGNTLFKKPANFQVHKKTLIDKLLIGACDSKAAGLIELFCCIENVVYLDIQSIKISELHNASSYITNILTLNISYSRITNDQELAEVVRKLKVHTLKLINSLSFRTLTKFLMRWDEVPLLLSIHIGTDLEPFLHPKIPIVIEGKVTKIH